MLTYILFLNQTYNITKAIKVTNAKIATPNSTMKSITTADKSEAECVGVNAVILVSPHSIIFNVL